MKFPFMVGDREKVGTVMDLGSIPETGLPYETVEAWASVSRSHVTNVLPDAKIFREAQPKEHFAHAASQMMVKAPKQIQGVPSALQTYATLMDEAKQIEVARQMMNAQDEQNGESAGVQQVSKSTLARDEDDDFGGDEAQATLSKKKGRGGAAGKRGGRGSDPRLAPATPSAFPPVARPGSRPVSPASSFRLPSMSPPAGRREKGIKVVKLDDGMIDLATVMAGAKPGRELQTALFVVFVAAKLRSPPPRAPPCQDHNPFLPS